jgi:pyruvate/2-oxoglutarate dehydrogenase complex dihydrolipoamide acyltransferase (E2) component
MHNFIIEKLNTNDDEYILIKYLVSNNHFVKKDQPFVEIETSKTTIVLDAPCDGFIIQKVKENSKIKVGDIISSFSKDKLTSIEPIKKKLENDKNKKYETGYKVSRPYNHSNNDEVNFQQTNSYPGVIIPKDSHKSAEAKNLLDVNFASLVSCLHKELNITERIEEQEGLFENNISDLIIYETSMLVKKYKKINSYLLTNGELKIYDYINFGYTIDVNDKLSVSSLGNTSQQDLNSIREKIEESILSATLNKFTTAQSKTATITLSDLSSNYLSGFYPLIPSKSSCTIGLSKPSKNKNMLSFSFDHRIIGGKYASDFLNELEKNILKHFKANLIEDKIDNEISIDDYECNYCGKDLNSAKDSNEPGFLKLLNNEGQEVLCCRICFQGW